ncbi:MAG: hypothetical protein CVU71_07045 [Deltaproteobacteria bacterium HGW-Deltaproteobacteria-6]|jgi:CheY-like chemotaxis protein|nr:MAG: hypothetical protein CVU71_07045 [Deltaproteobacteria bacterium HGW-Deltaproteobacteria-6]
MSAEATIAAPAGAMDDAEGRPFGFMAPEGDTAMVCEQDPAAREKIVSMLKSKGYAVVEAKSCGEAIKFMRFQIFNVIVVNENFDTPAGNVNSIVWNLEGLPMVTRRQTFVVLISAALKTLDNMTAYNKSVNVIINKSQVDNIETIFKKALAEHESFYHVFNGILRKQQKV